MSSKRWWESVLDIAADGYYLTRGVAEDGLNLANKVTDLPMSFSGRILQFGADAAHQLFLEQDPQKAINLPGEGEDSRYKPTGSVDLIGAAERGWRALPGNAKTTPQPNRSDDLEVSRATLTESFLNILTGTYEDVKELYEALPYDEQITKGFSNSGRFIMNLPLESLRAPSGMTTGAVKRQPLNADGSKKTIGQGIAEQALTYNEIYDLFQNVAQFSMLSWNDLEVQARRRQEGNPDTVAEAMGFVERQQHLWNVATTSSIGATITFSLVKVDPTDEVATTRYMLEHPETYNISSGMIDGIFRFVGDPGTRYLRLVKGSTWRNAKKFFTPNPTQSGPPLYTVKGLPKGPANTNVGKEFDIIDLVLDGDGNYSSVLDDHFKPNGNGMSLVKIIKDDADLTRSKLSTAARENNVYSVADEKIYNEGLGTFIENAVRETPIDAAVYGEVLANAPYKTLSTIYRAAVQSSDNESVINVLKLGMADYRQIPLIEEAAVEFGRIAAIITQPNVPENYLDDIDLFALQPMGEGKALPGEPIAASQVGIDSLRQRITYNVQSLQDHIKELNDVVGNRESFLDYLAKEKMPTKQASFNAQEQLAQNDKQYNFLTTSIEGIRATIASAVKDMSKVLTGDVDLLDAERIFKESLNKSAELYGQNVSNYVSNQISWSLPKDAASTVGIVALRNAKNLPFHDAYDMAIKQIENLLRPPETISPGVNDAGLWVRDAVPLDSVVTRTVVNNRALADEQATRELDANGFPVKQIIPQQHNTFREADVVAPVTKDPRTILNDPDQAQNPDVWEAFGGDKPYNQFAYRRGAINLHTARTYPGLIGRIVDSISDAYGPKGTFGSLIGPSMLVGVNDKVQLPAISKAKEIINSVKKSSIPNEAPLSSRNLTAEYFFSEAQDNIIVWKDMSVQNIDKAFRKMILDAEAIKPTISSSTSEIFKSVKKSKDVVTLAGYSKNELIARFVQMNVVEKQVLFNEVVKKLFTSIDRIYADVWPMTNEIKLSDQLYLSHKQNEISMQEAYSNNRTQIYGNSDIAYNEIGTNTAGEQVIQVQSFRVNDATSGPISPAQFQTASTIPDFRHINRDIRKILNQQNSAVGEVKVIEALSSLNDVLTMFWKRGKLARFPGYPLLTNLDDAFRSMQQMNILELSSGYFSGLADIRTSAIYRDIRKNSFNPTAVWVQKTKDELQIAFDKLGAEKVKQILNRENVVVQDFGTSKLVEVKALDVQATNIPSNLPGVSLTPDQALDTRVLPENSISFGNLELDHIQLLMVYDKFERLKHVPTQQTIWENVYKEAGYGYASKDLIQKGKIGNQTVRAITGLTIGSLLGGTAGLAATFGGVLAQRSLTRVAQREIALQGLNLQTYAKHLQKSHIDAQVKRYDDSIGIGAVNIYDDSVRSGSNNLNESLNSLQLTPPWRLDPKNKFDPTNPPLIEGAKEAAEGISLVVPELVGFKTFDNLLDDEIIVQSRTNNVSQQRGVYRRPTPNDVELMKSEELDTIFVYKRDPVTNEQISPAEIKTKTTTVIDEIAYSVLGSMSLQGSTIFLRHLFNRNSDIAKLGALSLFTGHYASTIGPQHLISTRAFEKQIPFLSNFFKYQNQTNSRSGTQIDDVKNLELDFEMQMREPITSDISVLDQKQLQSFIDTNKAIFERIAPGYDVIDDVTLAFEALAPNSISLDKLGIVSDKRVEGLINRTLNGGKGWEIVSTRTGVNLFDLLYTPKQQAILGLYHFSSVTSSGWAGPHTDKNKYLSNSISKQGSTPNTDADEMMLGLKEYGEKNYIPAENLMPSNWITDKELELLQDHLKGLSNNVLSQVNPGQEFINVYRSGDLIPDNNLDGPISFTLNPMFPGSNLLPWFNPDTSRSLASSKNIQEAFSQPQIMEERLKVLTKELNDLDDELALPNADWSDEGGRYQARRNIFNEINTLEGQHIEAKANYESLRNRYGIRTTQIDDMNFEYNIYDVADEQLRIFGIESKETRLIDGPDGSGQFLPEAPAPITISNLHKKQLDSSGNVLQSLINRFTKKKNAFNDTVAILNDQDLYDPQQKSYRPTLSETNDLDFYSYTVNNVELTARSLLEEALSPGFTGPRYEIIREGITETDYMRSVSNGLADLFQFLAKTAQTKIKAGSENWKITRSGTGSRDIVMGVSEAEEVAILTAIAKGDSSFFTMASQGDTVSKYKIPRNEVDFLLETRVKSNVEDELLIDPLKVTKEYDMMTEVNSEEALIAEIEQLKRAFAISLTGDLQQAKQHAHIMARTRDSYPELYDAADLAGRKQLAAGVQPTAIGSELLPGELGQNPQEWAISQKVKQDGVWARELYTTQLPNNSQVAQKTTQFTFDMPNGDVVFSAAWDNHINKFMVPLPDGAAMNAFRELPKRVWRGDTAKEIVTYLRSPDAADLMATAPIEWTENTLPIVSRMIREYNSMIPPMLEFAHVRKKAAQGIEVSWKADIEPVLSTMAPSNTVTGIRSPIFNIRENLGHVDFGKVTGSDAFKQLGEQLGISRNLLQKVDNAYDRLFLKSQSAMRDSTHKHHVTKYLENTIAAITPMLNPPMSRFIKTYPELAAQWNKDGYGFELNQVLQQSQNDATFSQYQQQPIMTEQLLRLRHERIEQFVDQDYAKRVGLSETFELLKKIKSGSAVTIDKSGNRVDVDVVSLLFPNGLTNIIKEMDVVKQPDSRGPNLEQWIVNDIAMPDRSLQIYTDFLLQTSRGYQPYAEVANEVGLFGGNFEINDTLTNLFVDRPTLNLLQTISKAIEDVSIIRQQINTLSFDHPNIDNPLLSNEIDAQGKIYNDAVSEGLDLAGDPSVPNLSLENANNTQSINYLALLRSSGIDQSQIDGILLKAKQYADNQVKQTLFNMAGKTKFQELFKTIAPFLGAGQEVLTSWTKHTYHDPIRTHKYVRAAIGSTEGEDENGNKRNTIKIPTSIYGLNLENGFGKFSDIAGKKIRANATSLLPINSTKSFNVFGGYYTSVISNEVLLKIPSLERALKMFIPYGLDPEGSMLKRAIKNLGPNWAIIASGKEFKVPGTNITYQANNERFNSTKSWAYDMLMVQHFEAGNEPLNQASLNAIDELSFEIAQNLIIAQAALASASPLPLQIVSPYTDNLNEYWETYKEYGQEIANEELWDTGYFMTTARRTQIVGAASGTQEGNFLFNKFETFIKEWPEIDDWVIGKYGPLGQELEYETSYNKVVVDSEISQGRRKVVSDPKRYFDTKVSMGWNDFNDLLRGVDQQWRIEVADYNINNAAVIEANPELERTLSKNQKAFKESTAGLVWQQGLKELTQTNTEWYNEWLDIGNPGVKIRTIQAFREVVKDPDFADRLEMASLKDYMDTRDQITNFMEDMGFAWSTDDDLFNQIRGSWLDFRDSISNPKINSNWIEFAPLYNRYFSDDEELNVNTGVNSVIPRLGIG